MRMKVPALFLSWRWPHSVVLCAALLWLAGYFGSFGSFGALNETVENLGRHPSASAWFTDSMAGRQEAKLVLFLFLVIAPVVSLIVAGMVLTVAGVCAIPLRRVVASERVGTFVLVIAIAVVFYFQSPMWWPPARPFAAIIARAYLVASEQADSNLHAPVVVPAAASH